MNKININKGRNLMKTMAAVVLVGMSTAGCVDMDFGRIDAGAVAARLLFDRLDPGADIVVGRIVHRGDAGSNQWRNREAGFRSYLEAHAFRGRLHYAALRLDDEGVVPDRRRIVGCPLVLGIQPEAPEVKSVCFFVNIYKPDFSNI